MVTAEGLLLDSLLELLGAEDSLVDVEAPAEELEASVLDEGVEELDASVLDEGVEELEEGAEEALEACLALAEPVETAALRLAAAVSAGSWPDASCT